MDGIPLTFPTIQGACLVWAEEGLFRGNPMNSWNDGPQSARFDKIFWRSLIQRLTKNWKQHGSTHILLLPDHWHTVVFDIWWYRTAASVSKELVFPMLKWNVAMQNMNTSSEFPNVSLNGWVDPPLGSSSDFDASGAIKYTRGSSPQPLYNI